MVWPNITPGSFRPFQGVYFSACEQREGNSDTLGSRGSPDQPDRTRLYDASADERQAPRALWITTL
jgi:hypothetical protein